MGKIKENDNTLPGGVTQEQIEAWKKKHEVHEIGIKGKDGKVYTCYLKDPDRNQMSLALSKFSAQKPLEAGEVFLNNCWLAGDEEIKTNDKLFVAAATQAAAIFDLPETSIKKL